MTLNTRNLQGVRPRQVVATDWHDGPHEGLAEYEGSPVLRFLLVGDPHAEVQTFVLWETELESLAALTARITGGGRAERRVCVVPAELDEESQGILKTGFDERQVIVGLLQARGIGEAPSRVVDVATRDREAVLARLVRGRYASEWTSYFPEGHDSRKTGA